MDVSAVVAFINTQAFAAVSLIGLAVLFVVVYLWAVRVIRKSL